MAIDKHSKQRLLRQYARARGRQPNAIVLHGTAGNDTSPHSTFARGASCSHFWIAYDGRREQYLDTNWRSAADRDGGARTISIETSNPVDGSGRWTAAQLDSIVDLIVWLIGQHPGIPVRLMTSSKTTEAGIGWHRLGCNGNFPRLPSLLAGRTQRGGGELWSSARGKVCPGDGRIEQMPEIEARVRARLTTIAPDEVPDVQEDDMPIIYRAGGERTRYGVLVQGLAAVELSTKAEYDNLRAAGVKEVWIERKTLDAIINGNRGQYTAVAIREGK